MAQKNILIVCGEASGDLNAASLAKKILEINPGIKIRAVGGTLLRQAGVEIFCDIKGLAVIGFFDALKKLPKFFTLQKTILQEIKTEKPDAIILVDFSGFNLRLARKVKRTIPTLYYVSPQVWASRSGRIKTIKEYIQKMIVLFKFEEDFYKRNGIAVDFIGHPLLDIVRPSMDKKDFLNKFRLAESKTTVALLPGSRKQEVENMLPLMLNTCLLISKRLRNTQFLIAKSPQVDWDIYNRKTHNLKIPVEIIEGQTYDCLEAADFCLVCSGTATLETAILGKPFVIIYKMNLLNYLLYRPQVKIPYIGMVNIVAKRKIIPEFIQYQARPKKIADEVIKILQNPSRIWQVKKDLAEVKALLGEKGASERAARILLDFLK